MSESLSDFENKLYSIRPFIETESPPSSNKKPQTNKIPSIMELANEQFKLQHPLSIIDDKCRQLTPLRKVFSQNCEPRHVQPIGQSNFKTISSISSTIDILFSKIERIKQQFSYALEKPHSLHQIKDQKQDTMFCSEKNIQYGYNNKENVSERLIYNPFIEKPKEESHKKQLLHSHSLPLQQKTDNFITKEYFSNPLNTENIQVKDILQNFQEERPNKQLQIRDFQLGKCIGSGKFGDVYLSIHKQTGFICAIKKIFKSTIREYKMEDQFINELKIHYSLSHPNIVKLYSHFEDEYHIFLMMEYACDGTLMQKLKSQQSFVSQSVNQLLDALSYMHHNNIIHRDIKPENIVCSLGTIKVCDFGWAAILQNNMKKTFCGTLDYVSPEMKDVGQYNESVDLWSVGVLTFELLAGFPPFKHEISYWKLCGSQRKTKWSWQVIYPPDISYFAQKFIQGLLRQNPLERTSIKSCLSNYFIHKYMEVKKGLEQQLQL